MVKAAAVDRPQRFVDTEEQLAACVDDVTRSAQVGLDTESNGFHAYFERVCLLQIADEMKPESRRVYVVWPCAERPLPFPVRYRNAEFAVYEVVGS